MGRRRDRLARGRPGSPADRACSARGKSPVTTMLTRPPIESLRPVVSFAVARVVLAGGALLADAILGFPFSTGLTAVLSAVALPWSAAMLSLVRILPTRALMSIVADCV